MKHFIVALGALLVASQAMASGFMVARFGGEHGHPTTANPTAMYYNPGALSLSKGTKIMIDGSLAWRKFTYTRDPGAIDNVLEEGELGAGTPADQVHANSGEGGLTNFIAAPFLGASTDFGVENLTVAIGAYVPFGGSSVYDKFDHNPKTPGASDGSQRWWVIEGSIRSLYATAAGAYYIPSLKLGFGVGLNAVISSVHTVRARNASGHDYTIVRGAGGDQIQEGRAVVNVKSTDLSLGAGLIWHPTPDWWVGLSYQSQPGFGENELEGEYEQILGNAKQAEPAQDVIIKQTMPDVFRAGLRFRPGKHEVRLFGDYIRWSVFKDQRVIGAEPDANGDDVKVTYIPRNWEDAFGVRAGYSFFLSEMNLELYAGAGFDQNAVPEETIDPSLYDTNKATGSLGARYTMMDNSLALAATYTQVFYFTREVDPREKDAAGVSVLPSSVSEDFRGPDAAGKYEQAIGVFNLNVQYAF